MKFSLLNFFSKKKEHNNRITNTTFLKTLKKIFNDGSFLLFENITIYHKKQTIFIPLLVLDKNYGLYLFEHKEWRYEDLKDATIEVATNCDSSYNSLSFQNSHKIIDEKLSELMNGYKVAIYNFLLMQNLTTPQYEELNISIKNLLPKRSIIFSDTIQENILKTVKHLSILETPIANEDKIIGCLLSQYLILEKEEKIYIATKQQRDFIDSKIKSHSTLYGEAASGKTSSILLKIILEKLRDPTLKVIIIEPTIIACNILKKKLLETLERAIIDIDISSIEIITPIELVNRHLKKIGKKELEIVLYIDNKLMNKNIKAADLIICDDSNLISFEFIAYLKHIQKKSSLLLVTNQDNHAQYSFTKSFRPNREVTFKKTNQYAKALQIITSELKNFSANDILVVSDNFSKNKLNEELESFIEDKVSLLDNTNTITNLEVNNLILSSYTHISGMSKKVVILLDVHTTAYNEIEYAVGLAQNRAYILYEDDECENIKSLRNRYESN